MRTWEVSSERVCVCMCVRLDMFVNEGSVCVLREWQNPRILSPDPEHGARAHFSPTTRSTGFQNSKHTPGVHLHNNQARDDSRVRRGIRLHLSNANKGR